jgi:hypothetical protein
LIVSGFLTSPWLHVRMSSAGGQADLQLVEEVHVEHGASFLVLSD